MSEHVIWDSWWRLDDDGFEDFVANSNFPEDSTDDEKLQAYADYIYSCLDDERINLDIPVSGTILMYGDAGRWNGPSYGAAPVGQNVADIFDAFAYGDYEVKFFVEDGDVYARWSGHDNPMGSMALFREADDEYIEYLDEGNPIGGEDAFRENTTSIADLVCNVYGW